MSDDAKEKLYHDYNAYQQQKKQSQPVDERSLDGRNQKGRKTWHRGEIEDPTGQEENNREARSHHNRHSEGSYTDGATHNEEERRLTREGKIIDPMKVINALKRIIHNDRKYE
jgi:hypothetical protein